MIIPNHYSATLSDLDMRMVRSVPEGGNWKDIPLDIPSKRLQQIRESFARGEGSRSTYYGRLRRDQPAYTINTYFSRPGNGCHIHYAQDRVLSQREAARIQTFPDAFEFSGSRTSINTQIGNAVPPLLAFQLAKSLPTTGMFLDLFAGAGGLGLGFMWAGWKPLFATDIESSFLQTYANNIHPNVICGDFTDEGLRKELVKVAKSARRRAAMPLWVLGGPPCQGFSTAGNARSAEDPRNKLVWDYVEFLRALKPDGFMFENVTGLLNIEGGQLFAGLRAAFQTALPHVANVVISTEDFAIPQRRRRVLIVGSRRSPWIPPSPITSSNQSLFTLSSAISVQDALSDLPPIKPGFDGTHLPYLYEPQNPFQRLMRGQISADAYLSQFPREGASAT